MNAAKLIGLSPLMARSEGNPEIVVGVIDGPVWLEHDGFRGQSISEISAGSSIACRDRDSAACVHGTLVMGMLSAKRNSGAVAICPNCRFLVRPIFSEPGDNHSEMPHATVDELCSAIQETVRAGARLINLSVGLDEPTLQDRMLLDDAFDFAAKQGVIVVAAAGNEGTIGSNLIASNPRVIPVVATDLMGRPSAQSNLGFSIGKHGFCAPGISVASLGPNDIVVTFSGTSAAAPFVTGAIALLWSEFPSISFSEMKGAITASRSRARRTIVPPLLNAWATFQLMELQHGGKLS